MTKNIKERPILFKAEMVRAILSGQKTMTRRIFKTRPTDDSPDAVFPDGTGNGFIAWWGPGPHTAEKTVFHYPEGGIPCPYGKVGDRLWVRETWREEGRGIVTYRATDPETIGKWKPSIFMPRKFSRINLEITGVKVERLQDISEEDAQAEGVGHGFQMNAGWPDYQHIKNGICELTQDTASMSFASLWDSINGKTPGCSWNDNPFVWAVSFKRLQGEAA